jgi:hypothetical protein
MRSAAWRLEQLSPFPNIDAMKTLPRYALQSAGLSRWKKASFFVQSLVNSRCRPGFSKLGG